MIQDPTNSYISAILSQCDLYGKVLLEIGCGKGRITRDLAQHAKRVLACDPDAAALETARNAVKAANVEFLLAPTGLPEAPPASFDLALYTLSLHHVPEPEMCDSLNAVARMVRGDGAIVVLEPGDGGSFTEAKERFGAGSGDERAARAAAIRAMHNLKGWTVGETILFRTSIQFDDVDDFLSNMLPQFRQRPAGFVEEVRKFLSAHRSESGILLDAGRRLNLLRRSA